MSNHSYNHLMDVFYLFLGFFALQFGRYLLFSWSADRLTRRASEIWRNRHLIQKSVPLRNQIKGEILHSFSTAAIIASITAMGFIFPGISSVYRDVKQYPLWWMPVSLVLLLIAHDTTFYWIHRLLHHPRLFKHAHHVHHYSTNPTPYTSNSFHPFEVVAEFLWIPLFLYFVPVYLGVMGIYSIIIMAMNVIGHLGYEIYPATWKTHFVLRWLNASTDHNRHHQHFRGNYGLYFRLWDIWMGTAMIETNGRTRTTD